MHVWHADTLDAVRRDFRLITGANPCPTIPVGGVSLLIFFFFATRTPNHVFVLSLILCRRVPKPCPVVQGERDLFLSFQIDLTVVIQLILVCLLSAGSRTPLR